MSKMRAEYGTTETFNAGMRNKKNSVRTGFVLFDRLG